MSSELLKASSPFQTFVTHFSYIRRIRLGVRVKKRHFKLVRRPSPFQAPKVRFVPAAQSASDHGLQSFYAFCLQDILLVEEKINMWKYQDWRDREGLMAAMDDVLWILNFLYVFFYLRCFIYNGHFIYIFLGGTKEQGESVDGKNL
jgi:hypothetical protein